MRRRLTNVNYSAVAFGTDGEPHLDKNHENNLIIIKLESTLMIITLLDVIGAVLIWHHRCENVFVSLSARGI